MIPLALALVVLQGARADSLPASGNVNAALALATKIVEHRPRDPAAHMLLGRVHYARPVVGRFPALEEFRTAARLAPLDPEPLYWQMKVGFYLRSDDGEIIAREALLRLFAITPDYEDAWARFGDVFHDEDIWRRAERALARHGDDPVALEHRAELLIALEQPTAADSLLARLGATARTCLLRAEANFLAGPSRGAAGYAWHDSALARADEDSTDALWDEAWLIASRDEVARHAALAPGERRAFYERFWEERDPDLLTPENERVAEHYARVAESRRMYRLPHPQRSLYHSQIARALGNVLAADQERSLQETAMPMAFRAGLTAEGLVFLRHGKPDARAFCISDVLHGITLARDTPCTNFIDEESWVYFTPDGPLSIRFGGGEYFAPISPDQTRSAIVLLRTDRTTLPAPLAPHAWSATFLADERGLTDVYYKASGDSAAVALWSGDGERRVAGRGLLHLAVAPGAYDLGLDVDSAGTLGRIRRATLVPFFSTGELSLSSLLLAAQDRGAALPSLDREATLRAMPADLTYSSGAALAAYLEIYGLRTDAAGRSRYHVRYTFAPLRSALARFLGAGARPVVFEFDRVVSGPRATESLVIEPDKLPSGRYRVAVAVTDVARNVKSESAALDIAIR